MTSSIVRDFCSVYDVAIVCGEKANRGEDLNIVNTIIYLRSPLYCKDKNGICKVCYGKLQDRLQSRQIGVIAGTVINSAGVEGYAMKARHQSIQVQFKDTDFTKDIITF